MKLTQAFVWMLLPSACALVPDAVTTPVTKDCVLSQDQSATLSGNWKATPIPIAFHQGSFNADQIQAIVKAADVWNTFFQASQGLQIFDYGTAENPRISAANKPASICAQNLTTTQGFAGPVMIFKDTSWTYSNHAAIALTSFCPQPATPRPSIYMAIMEVNYQDFFVTGTKQPDLQSIFVHELGHLIGLDHSCNLTDKSGFPNCNTSGLPPDYVSASMFPVVLFDNSGVGEQRRSLNSNDQGRANCLYGAHANGT